MNTHTLHYYRPHCALQVYPERPGFVREEINTQFPNIETATAWANAAGYDAVDHSGMPEKLVLTAAASLAGSAKSPAKTKAARRNGKKGGRPRKIDNASGETRFASETGMDARYFAKLVPPAQAAWNDRAQRGRIGARR